MQQPRQETLDILQRLISFPTVSRNSNLDLIDWIRSYLRGRGFVTRLSYDETSTKANLFATIGPQKEGGLLLSGHTDVVPVDGQDWHVDPFKATITEGRVYGRGACDMKGFIASVLSRVTAIDPARLDQPVHLAFTYDEEVGCKGVRTLLADLKAVGIQPSACIVGEPTDMRIVRAHKGSRNYRCCVRGKEAHASRTHEGVNAIQHAARVIGFIDMLSEQMSESPEAQSLFETPFDTLQTSLVQGGLARNIVPRDCEFTFGYRYLPRTDPDGIFEQIRDFGVREVLPRMQRAAADADIRFDKLSDNPALSPSMNGELARFALELNGAQGAGLGVSYMTEGGIYQQSGIPTIICGPGSISQAHKPDEFVELSQLAHCERFIESLWERQARAATPIQNIMTNKEQ